MINPANVTVAVRMLLEALGEDPDREGLRETPRRVAKMWREFLTTHAGGDWTTFQSNSFDQMVVVTGVRVWSMCEHHLLPFWCDLTMGYLVKGRMLGLSKFARMALTCAGRLQTQERLVEQIALDLHHATHSADVAVVAEGEHCCMVMRGVRTPHRMISSSLHGVFLHKPEARAEFFALARRA